ARDRHPGDDRRRFQANDVRRWVPVLPGVRDAVLQAAARALGTRADAVAPAPAGDDLRKELDHRASLRRIRWRVHPRRLAVVVLPPRVCGTLSSLSLS